MNAPANVESLQPDFTAGAAPSAASLALNSETPQRIEVDEILDALPTDDEKRAITNVVPLRYDLTTALLAGVRAQYEGVTFEVALPEGKAAAREAVTTLSKMRVALEEAYKTWNAPILAMTKIARDQRDYGREQLAKIIEPIQKQLDEQKEREDAEKRAKAQAEAERVDGHTAAVNAIQTLPKQYEKSDSATIAEALDKLKAFDYLSSRDWQEFMPGAQDAQRAAVDAMQMHLVNAQAREQLAKLQAEQAEKDAQRAAVDALRERITNIQMAPTAAIGASSATIQKTLDRLDRTDVSEFGDMQEQAQAAVDASRNALKTLLAGVQATEASAAQAQQQTDELAQLRKAEADRKAAEDRQREADEVAARAAEAEAQRQRDAEAARQREQEAAARARIQALAQTLLDLLVEAAPHVADPDLAARIESAITATKGE